MTMNIFPPSSTVRVGDTIALPFLCSEPGEVVFASSDESVATVEASKEISGTRVWRNGLKHGQYLARATASGAGRKDVSWCLEIDYARVCPPHAATTTSVHALTVIESAAYDKQRMLNWQFLVQTFRGSDATIFYRLFYHQSNAASAGETGFQLYSVASATPPIVRFVVTAPDPAVDNKLYTYYTTGINPDTTNTGRVVTADTMGGNQAIVVSGYVKASKFARLLSQADRQAYISAGTIPATPEFSYQGGHEIVESAPVFWDTSGNNLDLTDALDVPTWPPAAASCDYTDTVTVVPYSTVTVVAQSAGTCTISARRRRNGVPYRTPPLPDAEVYEDATCTLTVEDALASEQSTVQLMIYADRDGTALITMDNPIIDFPATVAVVEGKNQVAGLVTGSGTCNVTVTLDGVSDSVEVEVIALDWNLNIGPETTLDYEGLPTTFNLVVSCNRPETTVTLSSTGVGITLPDPPTVVITDVPVEVPITINGFGEYSVTAESGSYSSTALIHSINDTIDLYLEADRDIHTKDLPVTFDMRVFCSRDGEVTLNSTGGGIVVPDSATIVDGEATFSVAISEEGIKVVSAVFDTAYTECSLLVSEEAFLISLGEDRHVYYFGDEITITKTVFCNKDGIVFLTQIGDGLTIPSQVTVVDGQAEFEITCDGEVNSYIQAVHEDEPLVNTSCHIIVENAPSRVLHIGPDQTIVWESSEDDPVKYILAMVATDFAGTVLLSSSDANLVVPASIVCNGRVFVTFEAETSCDAVVTATKDGLTSTCRIIVQDTGTGSTTQTCQSSEDNVWALPDDREVDPTMFVGDAEKDFSKQIAEELMEKVVNQLVFYYPIDVQATNYHPMYGESITKKFHPPIKVFALVEWKGYDTKNAAYSLDKVPVIEVHFSKRRLEEDQGLVVKEGDFIKYGRDFYEITALNENAELFGAFNKKVDVSATCVKARKGTFYIEDKAFAKDTDFSWE